MSNEYTPTTEDVRNRYGSHDDTNDIDAEFDRWLADRDAKHEAAIRADQIAKDVNRALANRTKPLSGDIWGTARAVRKRIGASIRAQSPSPHEVTDDGPWEYGYPKGIVPDATYPTPAKAQKSVGAFLRGGPLMQRRPASKWEPVPAATEGEKRV